jgi:hypothetical protein
MNQNSRIFKDPVKYRVERLVFLAFSSLSGALLLQNLTKCLQLAFSDTKIPSFY